MSQRLTFGSRRRILGGQAERHQQGFELNWINANKFSYPTLTSCLTLQHLMETNHEPSQTTSKRVQARIKFLCLNINILPHFGAPLRLLDSQCKPLQKAQQKWNGVTYCEKYIQCSEDVSTGVASLRKMWVFENKSLLKLCIPLRHRILVEIVVCWRDVFRIDTKRGSS